MLITIDDILDKQDEQLKKNFTFKVSGYTLRGSYSEKGYTLSSIYKFQLPNKVKIEVHLPDGNKYMEGFDGGSSWEMDQIVDGRAAKALRHGAEWLNYIKSVKDFVLDGHDVEYLTTEFMKNQEYHKIKLSQKDGFGRFYFIHSSHYEIHYHQDIRPLHPNEETKFIQTELYEYNLVNGVNIHFKIVERDLETGNKLSKLITETPEINPRFVSTEFEIQKLKSIV